jgi:hypothetical protein
VRLLVIAIVLLIAGALGWTYLRNLPQFQPKPPPSTQEILDEDARPLLTALAKYRLQHATYPTALDRLVPTYLPSLNRFAEYIYTAQMEAPNSGAANAGALNFRLQSPDQHSQEGQALEEWSTYDSRSGTWTPGWCTHDRDAAGTITTSARNGICRW